jgi:Leucine-rich repeat (LRR) protein
MGLKRILGVVLCIAAFVGCSDGNNAPSLEVFCDGAKDPFPTAETIAQTSQLYLKHYASEQIYTMQPPSGLTHLCLIECDLTTLQPHLLTPALQYLWLSDNRLQKLPTQVSEARNLRYLNLDRNRLTLLPDLHLLPLKWLRANENQLSSLPRLPASIERLYLAHNNLSLAPEKTEHLKEVDLSYNPIKTLPDHFGAGLSRLDLAYTQITHLPADLSGWETLRFLNLAGCPMSNEEKDRIRHLLAPTTTLIF